MVWTPDFDEESEFCPCGIVLMGYPNEDNGLCGTCAGAPHGRECCCDECEEYWLGVSERSQMAAEEHRQQRAEGGPNA